MLITSQNLILRSCAPKVRLPALKQRIVPFEGKGQGSFSDLQLLQICQRRRLVHIDNRGALFDHLAFLDKNLFDLSALQVLDGMNRTNGLNFTRGKCEFSELSERAPKDKGKEESGAQKHDRFRHTWSTAILQAERLVETLGIVTAIDRRNFPLVL